MLSISQLAVLKTRDPFLYETLRQVVQAINYHGTTVGVDPTGAYPAPTKLASISVNVPETGVFDVVVNDSNPVRGVEYWLEWDTLPSFPAPRQIHLVGARNWRGFLSSTLTLYWRGASQFQGSDLTEWVVFGGAKPIGVDGSAPSGAAVQATSGSGAGPGIGAAAFPPVGVGRGRVPRAIPARNIR